MSIHKHQYAYARFFIVATLLLIITACTTNGDAGFTSVAEVAPISETRPVSSPTATTTAVLTTPTPILPAATPSVASPLPTATPIALADCGTQTAAATAAEYLNVLYTDLTGEGGALQIYVWDEETGSSQAIPMPEGNNKRFSTSPDKTMIAYTTVLDEHTYELWVMNIDGSNPRKLTTVSDEETWAINPNAMDISFSHRWLPHSGQLLYRFDTTYDGPSHERADTASYVIDVNTGDTFSILDSGDSYTFTFAPDGSQIAVVRGQTLHLIALSDGQIQHSFSFSEESNNHYYPIYAPNGRYLAVYDVETIVVIDSETGLRQDVAVPFAPLEPMYNGTTLKWHPDNDTFTVINQTDYFEQPEVTIWQGHIDQPTLQLQYALADSYHFHNSLSPNQAHFLFWQLNHEVESLNRRQLYLMDMTTGERQLYDEQDSVQLVSWSPDSTYFVYDFNLENQQSQTAVGATCAAPRILHQMLTEGRATWVGLRRFLTRNVRNGDWALRLITVDDEAIDVAEMSRGPHHSAYVSYWASDDSGTTFQK